MMTIGLGFVKSVHLFSESYNREQMVKSLGLLNYHVYDMAIGFKAPLQRLLVTEADAISTQEYLRNKDSVRQDLFGIAKGKNMVLISLESTQDFVMNQKVNGKEVTPFLNDLIKDSFYFNQIYDQTAQGKTSDAELMIDTSLYPLASGSVFVRRPENTYDSLPHILKENRDYYSAVFHGNVPTFWNRDVMYQTLGYDQFFSKKDYTVTEEKLDKLWNQRYPIFRTIRKEVRELTRTVLRQIPYLDKSFSFLVRRERYVHRTSGYRR